MNTVVNSGWSRLVTSAVWVVATATAAAWLAAFVYELRTVPQPSAGEVQHASGTAGHGTQADATTYWAEVGKAAGH
ncbi:MAG TPA: hypothetical protein VH183_06165 [Burkholderiaceae bacterium]|jgi:hypothetical protein|nr:hypothetical protein [Burkholderiaceae bacterium]